MQHHEKYSRTIRRSESGLRCGCAAVAAVLACAAPGFARHNRVTVTTYGDAAGTAARAERLKTIMECTPTEGHTAVWNYAYDLAGRQTSVSLAVDGGSASTVATYTYDGVGRLASKSFGIVGNGTSEEYVYDARSNVTGVSGSGFAQTAYFGTNPVEGGASRYLSPCAASERQYGAEGEGVSQTMWTYRYDGFGRLAEASATDAVSAPNRALGEVFEYDRNSNILSLERVYAGEPVQLFGTKRVTDRAHIGNRWSGFAGLGWHDNTARWHDAILDRFTTPDPKAADYPSFSPYAHCAANPLRFTDPTGCDTVMVNYADGKWVIDNTQLAEGNDVFIVNIDGKEQQYTFNIGDYGQRVDALNLEITDKYALGIMHVSGSEDNYYYVAPGGPSSNSVGSGARVNDGNYPIQAPASGAKWQKPGLGGSVVSRGIRFHYGGHNLRKASSGCFIITDDYEIEKGIVTPGIGNSKIASRKFDASLGASGHKNYIVPGSKSKIREGSTFLSPIKFVLVLKTL